MSFRLFLLVTGILLVRPTDYFPESGSLYLIAISACLLTSMEVVYRQLAVRSIIDQPITVAVFGVLAAMLLSSTCNLRFELLATHALEFFKVILFYLLLVGIIDSPTRFKSYLIGLALILCIPVGLAVLNHTGIITHPAFDASVADFKTGERYFVDDGRMRGTGMFGDPNDFCLLINMGLVLTVYGLEGSRSLLARCGWMAIFAFFAYALKLTESRGGLLAALCSFAVLTTMRLGIRRSILIGLVGLPLVLSIYGGRQVEFGVSDTRHTGQLRIQLWSNAMEVYKSAMVLGVGPEQTAEFISRSVHNSFIQVYSDLGWVGATFYLGLFYQAFRGLLRDRVRPSNRVDPGLMTMRPYVLALLVGYAAMMMSTSHAYHVSTFALIGIAAVYANLMAISQSMATTRFSGSLLGRWSLVSCTFLLVSMLYVRLNVTY